MKEKIKYYFSVTSFAAGFAAAGAFGGACIPIPGLNVVAAMLGGGFGGVLGGMLARGEIQPPKFSFRRRAKEK